MMELQAELKIVVKNGGGVLQLRLEAGANCLKFWNLKVQVYLEPLVTVTVTKGFTR